MTHIKTHDDFEWQQQYPTAHAAQTQDLESKNRFELPLGTTVEDGKLIYPDPPLIDNLRFLYEKVYELQPKSVFEVGFGYCNHLISLSRILPNMDPVAGCDISPRQMDGAYERYGMQLANLRLYISDFLLFNHSQKYDLVYSQAVVMHMSTERAMKAIEKMVGMSNKYVLSLDGGLAIPNIRGWLDTLGKVTYFDDFADKYWTSNNISPFLIEV